MQRGKRLQYEEIRHLPPLFKKDYFDFILKYDNDMAADLMKSHMNATNAYDSNSAAVWGAEDFLDTWDEV